MSETQAARTYPAKRQKIEPFARFKGTSVWKKYRGKARAYVQFRAAERQAAQASKAA